MYNIININNKIFSTNHKIYDIYVKIHYYVKL